VVKAKENINEYTPMNIAILSKLENKESDIMCINLYFNEM